MEVQAIHVSTDWYNKLGRVQLWEVWWEIPRGTQSGHKGCLQKRKVKGCALSRGTAFREAQQHEISWCLSWKYMNAGDLSWSSTCQEGHSEKTVCRNLSSLHPALNLGFIKAIRTNLGVLQRKVTWSYLHLRKFSLAERRWMDLMGAQQEEHKKNGLS